MGNPTTLKALSRGGTVICGGIQMSDIPSFPYELLWQKRTLCSVANLTRRHGEEFFSLISRLSVRTVIQEFPLSKATEALDNLSAGKLRGAAVLLNSA